jgi:hypothetical protein
VPDEKLIETKDGGVIIVQRSAEGEVLISLFAKDGQKLASVSLDDTNVRAYKNRLAKVLATKTAEVHTPYLLGDNTTTLQLNPPIKLEERDEEGLACIAH